MRESVPGLSWSSWWFASNLWHSLAHRNTTLISAFLFPCPFSCVQVCVQIFPFSKNTSHIGLGAHSTPLWLHPNLTNAICNDPVSKSSHILKSWGLELRHMNLEGGIQFNPLWTPYALWYFLTTALQGRLESIFLLYRWGKWGSESWKTPLKPHIQCVWWQHQDLNIRLHLSKFHSLYHTPASLQTHAFIRHPNNTVRWLLLLLPLYRWGNWSSGRWWDKANGCKARQWQSWDLNAGTWLLSLCSWQCHPSPIEKSWVCCTTQYSIM